MPRKLRIRVDHATCVGNAMCETFAPNVFAEPDKFDISRQPNPHVAFGNGVHHCLGATLARVEGQEVFKALAERFPNLTTVTEELDYQPSITFRSLKSLPVTWQ